MTNGFDKFFSGAEKRPSYVAAKQCLYVAKYIEDQMNLKNISNIELAEKLNTSKSYITKILRGDVNFTIETLAKVSCALDCELSIKISERRTMPDLNSVRSAALRSSVDEPKRLTLVSSNSSFSQKVGKPNADYTSEAAA